MARIIHDDQGDQAGASSEGDLTIIQADGQAKIELPDADFLAKGDILRDGQDLILQSSDGAEVVIEGYFSAMPAPTLTTPHGSVLTPELVESFVKSGGATEYAANGTESDVSAVGIVKEVSGDATVTRTDGTSEKVTLGMEIHQGDIVETSAEGAVNIVFLDESSFAISNNARLAIDEYVFDPASQSGETNVSILRGMFVFTSGLIGRDDPDDVQIDTPVGSIGIRGTTIAGHINPDGESQITVVEGAIVIKNGVTEVTLAEQYETITLTGFEDQIQMVGTLDSGEMRDSYGMIGTVNAGFINTLNTSSDETRDEIAPEEATPEAEPGSAPTDAPANDGTKPAEEGLLETSQPILASYDIFSDPLNSGFDQGVLLVPDGESLLDTKITMNAFMLGTESMVLETRNTAPVAESETEVVIVAEGPRLPPLEVVVQVFVDDDALSGDIVGRAFTTLPFPNAVITFLNVPLEGGDPIFRLVQQGPGVYNIILTDAGEIAITGLPLDTLLGLVVVEASLPDGRVNISQTPALYSDFTTVVASPALELSTIGGADGYRITGAAGSGTGFSVAYLGDYNHDGTSDFAVTTNVNAGGRVNISGYGAVPITGDTASLIVAGGGDINGDGYLDFVAGRAYFEDGFADQGRISIHSGASPATAAHANGGNASDLLGSSVALVDFDGDGNADVFAGAKLASGTQGEISSFLGYNGFGFTSVTMTPFETGAAAFDMLGLSMTGLADYNNDGFGDLAIGADGYVQIHMGNAAGTSGTPLTVVVPVDNYNLPLFDLGDLDGDGRSDLLMGATGFNADADGILEGAAWISFGGSGGAIGLRLHSAGNESVVGVGSAGDFNGDGYSDLFIATRNGDMVDAYVIYGSPSLSGTIVLDPTWIVNNPDRAFHMTLNLNGILNNPGTDNINLTGTGISDQNGDGFNDLLISSAEMNNGDGGFFVVYGRPDAASLGGPDPEIHATGINAPALGAVASSNNDGLVGNAASNTLGNLNGGNIYTGVSFQAGAGNDVIDLHGAGNAARLIDGGSGYDELRLFSTGAINLKNMSSFSGIEEIVLNGAGTQQLQIGLNDVFSLMQSSDAMLNAGAGMRLTLMITNDSAGAKSLQIDDAANNTSLSTAGFISAGTHVDGGNTYNLYTHGSGYQLLIENTITTTVA